MKVVIPAAGLGTRFLPYTKASPKEMLPVVDKPVIQYVIEEAVSAGCDDILIITGRGKRSVEDHFDRAPELENLLQEKNDHQSIEALEGVNELMEKVNIHYVRQKEQLGLGHAIHCARHHVGNDPFVVLLGDTIYLSDIPLTSQIIQTYERYGGPVIAVEEVPKEKISSYGIISGSMVSDDVCEIDELVEKPTPEEAPSNLGIIGAYLLTPDIFDAIEKTPPGKGGEIQLTDAMALLSKERKLYGQVFRGKRYDVGNKMDWFKAFMELALMRDEFSRELRSHMEVVLDGQ